MTYPLAERRKEGKFNKTTSKDLINGADGA